MLYYAGFIQSVGEVHDGDTVTDFLEAERQRGITIQSAAITFPWKTTTDNKPYVINLIDTPGHVDFTIEVERSLRVLDGGVVILDGSAGVQAQTLTVWRQADGHNEASNAKVPRIIYVNKMDKHNSDLEMTLTSIKDKLGCDPILTQMPVGQGKKFQGLIDLMTMEELRWSGAYGQSCQRSPLKSGGGGSSVELMERARERRNEMIEKLCDYDDQLAEFVLEQDSSNSDFYDSIPAETLLKSARKVVLSHPGKTALVLLGSSYKNIGVQPLMDAVAHFLPSPSEVQQPFLSKLPNKSKFCGLAFKIAHQKRKAGSSGAAQTFLRVYNGQLSEGDSVFNYRSGKSEKVSKLHVAFADDFKPVPSVKSGQIAVVSGLKETSTGDVLVSKDLRSLTDLLPPSMKVPDPVLFATVEAASLSQEKGLEQALRDIAREDPSFRVNFGSGSGGDEEGGSFHENRDQIVIAGMGELHFEIIMDRIKKEYKVEADLGSLMVAYRETVTEEVRDTFVFERTLFDKKMCVVLDLSVSPQIDANDDDASYGLEPTLKVNLQGQLDNGLLTLKPWQKKALERGFANAVSSGPLLGSPMVNLKCVVHDLSVGGQGLNAATDTIIASAMTEAFKSMALSAKAELLEPTMRLNITSDPECMPQIVQDLLVKRRAQMVTDWHDSSTSEAVANVTVLAPLSELRGYSTYIRSSASGRAFFGMEFCKFSAMSESAQSEAIAESNGY